MTAALTAAKRALMARLATEVGATAQVSIVRPLRDDLVTQESGTMVWACLVPESDTSGEIAVFGGGAPFRWDEDTTFRVLIQAACLVPVEAENALAAADASLAEADDLADAVLAALLKVVANDPSLGVDTGAKGVPGPRSVDVVPTRVIRQGGRIGDNGELCGVSMVVEMTVTAQTYSEEST